MNILTYYKTLENLQLVWLGKVKGKLTLDTVEDRPNSNTHPFIRKIFNVYLYKYI